MTGEWPERIHAFTNQTWLKWEEPPEEGTFLGMPYVRGDVHANEVKELKRIVQLQARQLSGLRSPEDEE